MSDNLLRCRFGEKVVTALWLSPNEVECITPYSERGLATFLLFNDNSYFNGTSLSFEFIDMFSPISYVYEHYGELIINGFNFFESDGWVCSFRSFSYAAYVVSAITLICPRPNLNMTNEDVFLTYPGGDTFASFFLYLFVLNSQLYLLFHHLHQDTGIHKFLLWLQI